MLLIKICKFNSNFLKLINSRHVSHYDILGVKSSATQAEIKSAYYKLSKLYHPDTNKGNKEFLNKFRNINSAYEILGNVKNRKLYDRGLVVGQSGTVLRDDVEEDPTARFYQKREKRSTVPSPLDGSTVYDFDAWTKAHYSKSKARYMKDKERFEYRAALRMEASRVRSSGQTAMGIVGSLMVALLLSNMLFADDFDRVGVANKLKSDNDDT